MTERVLLIDASPERRHALRRALERRGCVVAAEAGSIPELIRAIAQLETVPSTVLVADRIEGASPTRVARLLKRTWPDATVIQQGPRRTAPRQALAV